MKPGQMKKTNHIWRIWWKNTGKKKSGMIWNAEYFQQYNFWGKRFVLINNCKHSFPNHLHIHHLCFRRAGCILDPAQQGYYDSEMCLEDFIRVKFIHFWWTPQSNSYKPACPFVRPTRKNPGSWIHASGSRIMDIFIIHIFIIDTCIRIKDHIYLYRGYEHHANIHWGQGS